MALSGMFISAVHSYTEEDLENFTDWTGYGGRRRFCQRYARFGNGCQ